MESLFVFHNTWIFDLQDALIAIKSTGAPRPGSLPSFQEIKDTLGFNRYYKEEKQYATVQQAQPSSTNIVLRLKITEKSGTQKINEGIPVRTNPAFSHSHSLSLSSFSDSSHLQFSSNWCRLHFTTSCLLSSLFFLQQAGILEKISKAIPGL